MKKLLSKNFLIFLIGSGVNGIFPIAMIPLYTSSFSTEEFGLLMLFIVCVAITSSLISLSSHGAIYKKIHELSEINFYYYVFSIIILIFSICAVSSILLYYLNRMLMVFFEIPDKMDFFFYVILLSAFFLFLIQLKSSVYQIKKKALSFVFFQTSRNIFLFIFVLVLMYVDKLNVSNVLFSILLSYFFPAIYALISMLYRKEGIVRKEIVLYFSDIIKFGVPMIPTSLKDHVLSFSDRFFIIGFSGLTALGLYSLSFQLASVVLIISTAFNNAFTPIFFELLRKNDLDTNNKIVKLSYLYFFSFLTIAILVYLGALIYIRFFIGNEDYAGSINYLLPAVFSYMFISFHGIVVNYIYYTHKTILYGILNFSLILFSLILNYYSALFYGALGVAYSTLIVSFLMFLMTIVLSNKILPMPWLTFYKK